MKTLERDDLLIRLDERSANTWRAIEDMNKHLKELNGSVKYNTIWRRVIILIGTPSIGAFILHLIGVY